MHRGVVNMFTSGEFILLLILISSTIALFIYYIIRRFFPKLQAETMSSAFAVLGTTYGFILGFAISILWQNYHGAKKGVELEALNFDLIMNYSVSLSKTDQLKLYDGMEDYIKVVKEVEWPGMRNGEKTDKGWVSLNKLYTILQSMKLENMQQNLAYRDILILVDRVEGNRIARFQAADPMLGIGLRWVIIIGALFIIYSVAVHEMSNRINNIISILTTCILLSFNLAILLMLTYPFAGPLNIKGRVLFEEIPERLAVLKKNVQ